ncbi:MAG: hypothetical protein L0Y73_08780 [Candidatus Aminicenantes bacterium]|nr:hypothetical protein [Candidatus Aminicenantes bacterium]
MRITYQRIVWASVIIIFSVQFFVYAGSFEEGIEYLKKAKRAKSLQVNEKEINDYLETAYRCFKRSDKPQAKIYQVYIGRMIGLQTEIKKTAVDLLKIHGDRCTSLLGNLAALDRSDKESLGNYMNDVKAHVPYIGNIRLKEEVIYPFESGEPALQFSLNTNSDLNFSVNGMTMSYRHIAGENELPIKWRDEYLEKECIDLKLSAENDYSSDLKTKRLCFESNLPGNLYYDSNSKEFAIYGEELREESKIVRKQKPGILAEGLLYAVIVGGLSYLAITEDSNGVALTHKERMSNGYIGAGLVFCISISRFFGSSRNVSVPNTRNIAYNRKLREEIEKRKKEITVKLKLMDQDKTR